MKIGRLLPHFASCLLVLGSIAVLAPAFAEDWPQWRGPNRDGISRESSLLREWPEEGPRVVWQVDHVGEGYSSLAIKDGRIYTQGDLNGIEHILALDEKDGSIIWAVQPGPVAQQLAERVATEMTRLDANTDGVLDDVEAARLGKDIHKFDQPPKKASTDNLAIARDRVSRLIGKLDANKDGKLEFSEAGEVLRDDFARMDKEDKSADAAALSSSRAAQLVKQLDKDGDGKISRDESRRSAIDRPFGQADQRIEGTTKGDNQLTREEIEAYLSKREAGRDGLLDEQELVDFFVARYPGGDGILTTDELRCFYGGYRNGQGNGPRGTPTVDGTVLYTVGGNGDLTCLDSSTGKTIWHRSLIKDFGGGRPGWGYCESPLIVGEWVIVTPGGKAGTVVALNKQDGELVWRSSGTTQGAHYSSPVLAEIGGIKQIVQFARSSMFGITLEEGKLLWEYKNANNGTANVASPIVANDQVFASSAYGTGGGLAKVTTDGDSQAAEEVYFEKKMANHHGGIVKVGDHMYGFGSGGLICMNFETGKIAWQARSVGKGSLVVADNMLYLLGERHEVALAEVTPDEYREHGRFKIESHGRPSWAHPVVSNGRFYIRDQGTLTAYDVQQ